MTLKTLMMTAAASALIAGGAIAQDTSTTDTTGVDTTVTDVAPAAPQFTSISEMTVGDLVGQNVYEPNGKTIGDIDYIIGAGGGADAIIGIGGFLGLGEYTVALPLEEFTFDAESQMVKLDTTKDALKEQPEFDESEAESLPDETPLADLMASADTSADTSATTSTADDGAMKTDDDMADDASASDGTTMTEEGATEGDDSMETEVIEETDVIEEEPATEEEPAAE
ncbi:PRC-barrel domain-containing protein [Roseovarius sp. Pro17]|uniref:PRC-barrel domain-containing protein n=1 Tax=Roseovarius sp. Pro17 TaxID=3108175 RepID=UPI002D77CB43|nr:PRC-barrel domain-containing protein [Roseovarius sp. Pro17]